MSFFVSIHTIQNVIAGEQVVKKAKNLVIVACEQPLVVMRLDPIPRFGLLENSEHSLWTVTNTTHHNRVKAFLKQHSYFFIFNEHQYATRTLARSTKLYVCFPLNFGPRLPQILKCCNGNIKRYKFCSQVAKPHLSNIPLINSSLRSIYQ